MSFGAASCHPVLTQDSKEQYSY